MKIQNSYKDEERGSLFIVPTPIGNLNDMTFRAVETLKSVDVIAAEDTRNTKKLLNHFDIHTPLVSYHEHNKHTKGPQLVEQMIQGDRIAAVSDAGMPGISDPGSDLVREAISEDLPVIVLPGANAALPALAGSGLPTEQFYFCGFLPRKKKDREAALVNLKNVPATVIFYESPHRLKEMLNHVREVFGNRQAALARELTKRYEEFVRGSIDELIDWAEKGEVRGEFCVIVEGTEEAEGQDDYWWTHFSIIDHVNHYIEEKGMKSKEAIKQTSVDRKLSKRDVYQAYHVEEN